MSQEDEKKLFKSQGDALNRLVDNQDFRDIFLKDYLDSHIKELYLREGNSDGVGKAINAVKYFNDYLYGIITNAEIANQ